MICNLARREISKSIGNGISKITKGCMMYNKRFTSTSMTIDKDKDKDKDINKSNNTGSAITNSQMMQKLKGVSVYKRILPKYGIPFNSKKSSVMLNEGITSGSCCSFFQLMDQFQTQGDPTYCGPATMACILNSLNIDPRRKWKG